MTLGAGVLTVRRFQVLAKPSEINIPWILERMSRHFIHPLRIDEVREEALGFCHPFTGEGKIPDPYTLFYNEGFMFGLRSDKKKIPSTLFKLQLKMALETLQENSSRPLSKVQKEQVHSRIKEELLSHTLPHVRLTECVWFLHTQEIWVLAASEGVIEEFKNLFAEGFELPLVHRNSGTYGVDFESLIKGRGISLQRFLDILPVGLVS
jgi:DNA recombination-dependent growth factor C